MNARILLVALAAGLALAAPAIAADAPEPSPAGSLEAAAEAWRQGAFREALEVLDRALAGDASLRGDPRALGILHGLLGGLDHAAAALEDPAAQTALAPLAPSAANLRERLRPVSLAGRPAFFFASGIVTDTEPGLVGDLSPLRFARRRPADERIEVALRGRGPVYQGEHASLVVGYEGALGLDIDEQDSDVQTHSPSVAAGWLVGPVRLGVRYDYAFSFLDLDDPYRHLHRVAPSLALRESHWGVTRLGYQFQDQDVIEPAGGDPALDRDGERHAVQLDQFFFLPKPFSYFTLGAFGDFLDTDGSEWRYDAVGASFGAGYDFDHGIGLGWLYRYAHRRYGEPSVVNGDRRRDHRHELSLEIGAALTPWLRVMATGAFTWNDSDIGVYDYTRQVGGAHVAVAF